jgi:dTMP kinase
MFKWIVIEGGEGSGKSSLVSSMNDYLTDQGYRVLVTKEPGSPHCPVTMQLRNIMLNAEFDNEMTVAGRELVSQAIRSIHINWIYSVRDQYDVVLQDRGILSGYVYGTQTGNSKEFLEQMARAVTGWNYLNVEEIIGNLYNFTLFLKCDAVVGLKRAGRAKQEFSAGDAMEMRGLDFHEGIQKNFIYMMEEGIKWGPGSSGGIIDVETIPRHVVFDQARVMIDSVLLK